MIQIFISNLYSFCYIFIYKCSLEYKKINKYYIIMEDPLQVSIGELVVINQQFNMLYHVYVVPDIRDICDYYV